MKKVKVLLAAAFCAITSLNAFGGHCVNSTISGLALLGGSCTIGNLNQWSLSSFGLANAGGFGYAGTVAPGDIFVTFTDETSVGGAAGFAIRFSDGTTAPNFFSATSAGVSQSQNWRSMFIIENGPAIQRINNSWQNANVTNPQPGTSNGSISLNKAIFNASVTPQSFLADVTLLAVPGLLIPASGSADVGIGLPNTITRLGVEDNFQIQAGVNGVSSLTSYTNTFYGANPTVVIDPPPTGAIPEPMTFLLMGAGLIGIAALRRRNGKVIREAGIREE